MQPDRQFRAYDTVEYVDNDGDPYGIEGIVLSDESDGDTHIRVRIIDDDCSIHRASLRLVTPHD